MTDLTARIEALNLSVALEEAAHVIECHAEELTTDEWAMWTRRLSRGLLTALEQAETRVEQAKRQGDERAAFWITCWQSKAMQAVIGAARLKLAERRIAELEAAYADLDARFDHQMQAEAALAAEREKQARRLRDPKKGEWKRKYFQSRAALDAERAKRCVHAVASTCPFYFAESTSSNQVPNVAQQGSERDAEGTGEGGE